MAYQFCFCPQVLIFAEDVALKQTNIVQRRNPPLLHIIAILQPCAGPFSPIFQPYGLQKLLDHFGFVFEFPLSPYDQVSVVLTNPLKNNGRFAFLNPQTSKTQLNLFCFLSQNIIQSTISL